MGIIKTKNPRQYANTTNQVVCQQSAIRLKAGKTKKKRSGAGSNMSGYCKARRNGKPSNHPIK